MTDHISKRLDRMREGRRLRSIEQEHFKANVQHERDLASHLRASESISFQPAVEVVKGTLLDMSAGLAQLVGSTERAAQLKGKRRALATASFEELSKVSGGDPDIIELAQTFQNVSKSGTQGALLLATGGGSAALIGGSGLLRGADVFTESKLRGKSTAQSLAKGATSGIIEAGITALFQRSGLGGIESQTIKSQLSNTLRNSFTNISKETGKQIGAELLEESSIAGLDKIAQSFLEGKGPQDLQDPQFWVDMEKELTQVLKETLIAGGLSEGLRAPGRARATKELRQEFESIVAEESGKREAADLQKVQNAAIAAVEQQAIQEDVLRDDVAKREQRREEQRQFEQKEEALDSVRAQNAALRGEIDQQVQDKALARQDLLATIAAEAAVDTAVMQGLQELNIRREEQRADRQLKIENADLEVAKSELNAAADVMDAFFPQEQAALREQIGGVETLEDAIAIDQIIQEKVDNIPIEHGEVRAALQVRLNDARAQGQLEGEAHIQALAAQEGKAEEQDLGQAIAQEQALAEGQLAAEAEFIPPKKRGRPRKKAPIKRPVEQEFAGPEFRPAEEAARVDEFATIEDIAAPPKPKKRAPKAPKAAPKKAPVKPTDKKPFTPPQQAKLEDLVPRDISPEKLAAEVNRVSELAKGHFGKDVDIEIKKNHVLVTLPNGRRIGIFTISQQEAAGEIAKLPAQSFASMQAKGIDVGMTLKQWRNLSDSQRTQILLDRGVSALGGIIPNPVSSDITMDIDSAIFLTDGRADMTSLQEEAVHDAFIGLMTDTQLDTINSELIRLGRLKKGGNDLRNDAEFIEEGFELYRDWLNQQPVGLAAKVKKIFRKILNFGNKLNDVFEAVRTGDIGFQEQVAPTTPADARRPRILEERRPTPPGEEGALVTETVVARTREEKQRAAKKVPKVARGEQKKLGEELISEKGESAVLKGIREKLRDDAPLGLSEQRALDALIKKQGRKLDDIAQEENPDTFFEEDAALIDLLRLREQQGSLMGRGLEAFKDGTPVDKKAFLLGQVFSLTRKEQTQVSNLEREGNQAKADKLTRDFQKKHYKKFVKFLKDGGLNIEDLNSELINDQMFFSVAAHAAESAKEGKKVLGLLNVLPINWVLGFGTLGKVGVANVLGTAFNVAETSAKGMINALTGNNIKSLPTGREALNSVKSSLQNMFSGFEFISQAYTQAGAPVFDKLRGQEILGQTEQEKAQGFQDDVERVLPASDKRPGVQALRKLFLTVSFPTRSLGSLDQIMIAPMVAGMVETIPHQEARALGLEGQDLKDFLQFVADPGSLAQTGIDRGLEDKQLDEFITDWRDRIDPVFDEIEAEVRKVTASLAFDDSTFAGQLGKKAEAIINTEIGGIRPLRFAAPVFRGPIRGVEFAARRAPIISGIAAAVDYARFRKDPTNARKRQAASQAVIAVMAHAIPAVVASLLDKEDEEQLAKAQIGGVDFARVPFAGELTKLYGEYISLMEKGKIDQAHAVISKAFTMLAEATPLRTAGRVAFSKDPAKRALEEFGSIFQRKGEFREPAAVRDVRGQVTGEKEFKELFGLREAKK